MSTRKLDSIVKYLLAGVVRVTICAKGQVDHDLRVNIHVGGGDQVSISGGWAEARREGN